MTACIAAGGMWAGGCTSKPIGIADGTSSETRARVYADAAFRMDVVLYAQAFASPGNGSDSDSSIATDPVLQPSRMILEPGGMLRAAFGPGSTSQVYPPRARVLTREENAEIAMLSEALLTQAGPNTTPGATPINKAAPALATSDGLLPVQPDPVLVISATIDGTPRYAALAGADLELARPLMARLSELVWQPATFSE